MGNDKVYYLINCRSLWDRVNSPDDIKNCCPYISTSLDRRHFARCWARLPTGG